MNKLKGELLLLIAAVIWGSSFIFQKMGMDYIGPLTFTFFRFGIGAVAMIPVMKVSDGIKKRRDECNIISLRNRLLVTGGILVGVSNFAAATLQQGGLVFTTAGKAGFITTMDMAIVPFILILLKRQVPALTWTGVAIAMVGMYLLCMKEGFSVNKGDLLCFAGAAGYAVQIILIDAYVDKVDPIKLAFFEFAVTAAIALPFAIIFEGINLTLVAQCAIPLLYTAILEVCVAFSLQMIGQKYAPPAIATIIMSLESVFAVICGALFLGEVMAGREITGCVIMFAALIIAQIPEMRNDDSI